MCEPFPDCDSVSTGKSEFRPSLKYLLTGWRLRNSSSGFPFDHSQERKLCKIVFGSWKSQKYLSKEQFQIAAYGLAKENNLKVHPVWEKCGRASDKWLKNFLRRHPSLKGMLTEKPGVPPRRKSNHSEEDIFSDSASDLSSSDESFDWVELFTDLETEHEESRTASLPESQVCEDTLLSVVPSSYTDVENHNS